MFCRWQPDSLYKIRQYRVSQFVSLHTYMERGRSSRIYFSFHGNVWVEERKTISYKIDLIKVRFLFRNKKHFILYTNLWSVITRFWWRSDLYPLNIVVSICTIRFYSVNCPHSACCFLWVLKQQLFLFYNTTIVRFFWWKHSLFSVRDGINLYVECWFASDFKGRAICFVSWIHSLVFVLISKLISLLYIHKIATRQYLNYFLHTYRAALNKYWVLITFTDIFCFPLTRNFK
jgi:hypothetical protein